MRSSPRATNAIHLKVCAASLTLESISFDVARCDAPLISNPVRMASQHSFEDLSGPFGPTETRVGEQILQELVLRLAHAARVRLRVRLR